MDDFIGELLDRIDASGQNFSQRAYEALGQDLEPLLRLLFIIAVLFYGVQLFLGTSRLGDSARPVRGALDARFAKAARKLKALAKAPARSGSQRGKAGSWAGVFDETVPDELEIAEAESLTLSA